MNSDRKNHFIGLLITSLSIGISAAFIENSINNFVDSLLPDAKGISNFNRAGTITILSTNGKIIQKLGPATREKVQQSQMPDLLEKAFVAAEDRRFYTHKGVDFWGICRALITNIKTGFVKEGASTITQQLARTIFLSQDRTLTRKLKEALLAYKLERQLSKEEILEQYLNNVYLGSGAYGVADAAWVYFSKNPNQLSLEEAALIAGLAPAPSIYSPLVNPEKAIKRRSIVLRKMKATGFLSNEEVAKASSSKLKLNPARPKYLDSSAPFFTSWVSKQLPKLLTKEQLEIGGLKIRTSLNLDWQKKAQEIIRTKSPEGSQGSIVSIQPQNGLVRVMVGGKDFDSTQFNRATQALRSPGSTFKLFPYLAAIDNGVSPEDKFIDKPNCWGGYCPKNFGKRYLGEVSLSYALQQSLNTIAVQLLDKVGFEEVIKIANQLGIGNERILGKYYPLAIGAYEQTVLDMSAAYAAIANRGIFHAPTPFEEIRGPNNVVLWSHKKDRNKGIQAVKKETADAVNLMLQKVVSDGTGIDARLKDRTVAGKTGTSEGSRDLWFIGSIPQLTTGIWFGHDDNKSFRSSSSKAASAWKIFMEKISEDLLLLEFPNIEVNHSRIEKNRNNLNNIFTESPLFKEIE